MDAARKNALLGHLVDIRRTASIDDTTFNQIVDGELKQLTKSIYIHKATWEALKLHEQSLSLIHI